MVAVLADGYEGMSELISKIVIHQHATAFFLTFFDKVSAFLDRSRKFERDHLRHLFIVDNVSDITQ